MIFKYALEVQEWRENMNYIAKTERYETMKYNRCGKSGLFLPAMSLGLWHNFGNTSDFTNCREMLLESFDRALHILIWPIITGRRPEARRRHSGA